MKERRESPVLTHRVKKKNMTHTLIENWRSLRKTNGLTFTTNTRAQNKQRKTKDRSRAERLHHRVDRLWQIGYAPCFSHFLAHRPQQELWLITYQSSRQVRRQLVSHLLVQHHEQLRLQSRVDDVRPDDVHQTQRPKPEGDYW
jgi:hypothetical protein